MITKEESEKNSGTVKVKEDKEAKKELGTLRHMLFNYSLTYFSKNDTSTIDSAFNSAEIPKILTKSLTESLKTLWPYNEALIDKKTRTLEDELPKVWETTEIILGRLASRGYSFFESELSVGKSRLDAVFIKLNKNTTTNYLIVDFKTTDKENLKQYSKWSQKWIDQLKEYKEALIKKMKIPENLPIFTMIIRTNLREHLFLTQDTLSSKPFTKKFNPSYIPECPPETFFGICNTKDASNYGFFEEHKISHLELQNWLVNEFFTSLTTGKFQNKEELYVGKSKVERKKFFTSLRLNSSNVRKIFKEYEGNIKTEDVIFTENYLRLNFDKILASARERNLLGNTKDNAHTIYLAIGYLWWYHLYQTWKNTGKNQPFKDFEDSLWNEYLPPKVKS